MRLGALLGPVEPADTKGLAEQARRLEGEGFDSLWSAQAVGRGHFLADPFVALTAAAAVTERVELGTAILQLPLFHPADIAFKALSVMQVSGNRLLLGLGPGSTEADHTVHGSDFAARFTRFNSALAELRQIFATGEAGGHSLAAWDAAAGGPPLLYGTWGKGVARAAKEFDGWIASGMNRTADQIAEVAPAYHKAGGARAIVSSLMLTADTQLPDLEALLARYAEMGFADAVVMFLPGAPAPAQVRRLAP